MTLLPVTLCAAAAAAIINIWLSMRIGGVRRAEKISIGDGGNDLLSRRMRAQLNFAENVPLALVLFAAIELSDKGDQWLAIVAGVFMLGRVAHGLGMDGTSFGVGRAIGTATTMLIMLGLAIYAVLIALGSV